MIGTLKEWQSQGSWQDDQLSAWAAAGLAFVDPDTNGDASADVNNFPLFEYEKKAREERLGMPLRSRPEVVPSHNLYVKLGDNDKE